MKNLAPLPPRPAQIPIAKPTLPCAKVNIPTNNMNDMGTHPFNQGNTSKLQWDISSKKTNLTAPNPGNNSQGTNSNIKT